jgi:hypothetical protein
VKKPRNKNEIIHLDSAIISPMTGDILIMMRKETFTSVPGILRPFKEFLQSLNITDKDQIVYYGCVGTCTPFVELLAIAIRGLHPEQVFVPLLDETKAQKIVNIDNIGMQVSGGPPHHLNPKVLVFMGGLAMPNMPLTKEDVKECIQKHSNANVIGVCFMSMFKKAGWLDTISFDMMIDATIDPVTVTWKES